MGYTWFIKVMYPDYLGDMRTEFYGTDYRKMQRRDLPKATGFSDCYACDYGLKRLVKTLDENNLCMTGHTTSELGYKYIPMRVKFSGG